MSNVTWCVCTTFPHHSGDDDGLAAGRLRPFYEDHPASVLPANKALRKGFNTKIFKSSLNLGQLRHPTRQIDVIDVSFRGFGG